ncbi:hypothetical protein B0H19DRAFT_1253409 [Mycena capillaripes]|nr:hypothetical protein B0H19DRAFT_1253409 [Mycena capillaripes]
MYQSQNLKLKEDLTEVQRENAELKATLEALNQVDKDREKETDLLYFGADCDEKRILRLNEELEEFEAAVARLKLDCEEMDWDALGAKEIELLPYNSHDSVPLAYLNVLSAQPQSLCDEGVSAPNGAKQEVYLKYLAQLRDDGEAVSPALSELATA